MLIGLSHLNEWIPKTMASLVKVNSIQESDLNNGVSIDSNLKISGTEIASKTSGIVNLQNTTINSNVQFPAGHILQVQSKNETAIRNTTSTSFAEIHTDFFAELTTIGNNSKILVHGTLHLGASDPGVRMGTVMYRSIAGAAYAVTDFRGDEAENRARAIFGSTPGARSDQQLNAGFSFVDNPQQNAGIVLRYKPYRFCEHSSHTIYLNRSSSDGNYFNHPRLVSSIVIMEVAQ